MSALKYNIFLNKTSNNFSNRGFEAILALGLALGSLVLLLLFPVAGIALAIFAYGFICIGTKTYLLGIARGKYLPIETVFSKFKTCIKAFCLKFATMLITFLWGLIFVIPGIITALNYSMASFVMADEDLPALDSMVKSKKLVYGYRSEIFIIYLSYIFVTMVILALAMAIALGIDFYLAPPLWIWLVVMGIVALFFILVFVVPYFELMFANIYLTIKEEQEPKVSKTQSTARAKQAGTEKTPATQNTAKKSADSAKETTKVATLAQSKNDKTKSNNLSKNNKKKKNKE